MRVFRELLSVELSFERNLEKFLFWLLLNEKVGVYSFVLFDAKAMSSVKDRGVEQLVAREAHNLEVVGSSPAPAT